MKRIIFSLLALILLFPPLVKAEAIGDIDGDNQVDVADVTKLIDYILTNGEWNLAFDLNNDNEVDVGDVTTLIEIILNTQTETPTDEVFNINGVSFTMVYVEGGTYMMGATDDDDVAFARERPRHQVTLSSYYIGQTEVTQALWIAVMGTNPSTFTGANGYVDDLTRPVETVNWSDCQNFISQLNQLTGKTFRMPTEAEWEFAARGGNKSMGYIFSGSNDINEVAWWHGNHSNSYYGTKPVATKAPNELGLYDMTGNLYDWCADWFGDYSSEPQTNPTGPERGTYRVFRGGYYLNYTNKCRVSFRHYYYPTSRFNYVGLRLAL